MIHNLDWFCIQKDKFILQDYTFASSPYCTVLCCTLLLAIAIHGDGTTAKRRQNKGLLQVDTILMQVGDW